MAFNEQTLEGFIEAKMLATEVLKDEGVRSRALSFEEALMMQAASHLLSEQNSFFGFEIIRFTQADAGSLYPILRRFEDQYTILASEFEDLNMRLAKIGVRDVCIKQPSSATGY